MSRIEIRARKEATNLIMCMDQLLLKERCNDSVDLHFLKSQFRWALTVYQRDTSEAGHNIAEDIFEEMDWKEKEIDFYHIYNDEIITELDWRIHYELMSESWSRVIFLGMVLSFYMASSHMVASKLQEGIDIDVIDKLKGVSRSDFDSITRSLEENKRLPSQYFFFIEKRTPMKILIDGSNVQYRSFLRRGKDSKPDIRQLVSLCLALFKEGHDFIVYVDANTRHQYSDDQAKIHLDTLFREFPQTFFESPGKTQADDFILNHANEENLSVLTNDQYRDYSNTYPFVWKQSRFIRFTQGEGPINIPSLGMLVHVQKDNKDFNELRSLLGARMVHIIDSEGQYVTTDLEAGGILKANRTDPQAWEIFRLIDRGRSQFVLLSSNRRYVAVDINRNASLVADRKTAGEWELFTVHETDSGACLRAHNKMFVSARRDEGKLLRACGETEGLWEHFRIEDLIESPQ